MIYFQHWWWVQHSEHRNSSEHPGGGAQHHPHIRDGSGDSRGQRGTDQNQEGAGESKLFWFWWFWWRSVKSALSVIILTLKHLWIPLSQQQDDNNSLKKIKAIILNSEILLRTTSVELQVFGRWMLLLEVVLHTQCSVCITQFQPIREEKWRVTDQWERVMLSVCC